MRTPKLLLVIFMVTLISVVYVYQQSRIFDLAYSSSKKQTVMKDLLDANNILRYNLNVISSLSYLDKKLFSRNADFEMPNSEQLVRLTSARERIGLTQELKKRNNLLAILFGIEKQAEAKTLNR